MSIKTLIFDFDGTIADTYDVTLDLGNKLAPEYGYNAITREEADMLRARPYREVAAYIGIAWHRIPVVAMRIRRELARSIPSLPVIAGLPPVLEALSETCQLGIVTANSQDNVKAFLSAHELDMFSFVATASNVWGKGRRLQRLLRSRGLSADEVAYVGDEVRDVEATRAAAMRMIAVAWGYSARAALAAQAPTYLVDTPDDLLTLVRRECGV